MAGSNIKIQKMEMHMSISRSMRRPEAIRFLKSKPQQMTLLPLALENIIIEESGGDAGEVTRRAPRLEEVEAALRAYFAAADGLPAVEPVAPAPRVMRVKEAAKALGIAVPTVRLWCRTGKLRKVTLSPGAVGVCAEDVASFIAKARGA